MMVAEAEAHAADEVRAPCTGPLLPEKHLTAGLVCCLLGNCGCGAEALMGVIRTPSSHALDHCK